MSNGYWSNDSVCGEPVWHDFPTFTFADARYQCSSCPIENGQVWRDDLFVGASVPRYPGHGNDHGRDGSFSPANALYQKSLQSCCQDGSCPFCFTGPILG